MKILKSILCLVIFFGTIETVAAQQISYRKEQIYVDNKLYGYLLKTGSVWAKDFSFQNTNNEELAVAKAITKELKDGFDYVYYEVAFKGYKQKAEMEDNSEFAQRLARELASFNILKNDVLDPAAVQKFLEKYPPSISNRLNAIPHKAPVSPAKEKAIVKTETTENSDLKSNQVSTTEPITNTKPVLATEPTAVALTKPAAANSGSKPELNAGAPVSVSSASAMNKTGAKNAIVLNLKVTGTTILKGNIKVGRFAVNEKAVNDKLKKTYTFYNAKNLKVADASFANPTSTECKITTSKDKKMRSLKIANDGEALKALASWLVQNRYL